MIDALKLEEDQIQHPADGNDETKSITRDTGQLLMNRCSKS